MRLHFLGTGSGTPTRRRNVSSAVLQRPDGELWVFDCGEGTQQRLLLSPLRPGRITRICISHVHGDHCYGLPGLLACLAVHGRQDPVHIHGPPGLEDWVRATLRFSVLDPPFPLHFLTCEPGYGCETVVFADGWSLAALPLPHRVPSLAWIVSEPDRRGHVDTTVAAERGLDGPAIGRVLRSEPVSDRLGQPVLAEDLLSAPLPGRVLVICGDSADSSGLIGRIERCDCLVHESTYADDRAHQAQTWGHSTAGHAGEVAAGLHAKLLVLNHISARYDEEGSLGVAGLAAQAQAKCPQTRVLVAEDLSVVDIG